MAYDLAIDWSTAEVSMYRDALKLEVSLTGVADAQWRYAFDALRARLKPTDGYWINSVSIDGARLEGGFEEDCDQQLKERLEELVREANVWAADEAEEGQQKKRDEKEQAEALERAAREAAERLRGS